MRISEHRLHIARIARELEESSDYARAYKEMSEVARAAASKAEQAEETRDAAQREATKQTGLRREAERVLREGFSFAHTHMGWTEDAAWEAFKILKSKPPTD